jgi:hypothetical protein
VPHVRRQEEHVPLAQLHSLESAALFKEEICVTL